MFRKTKVRNSLIWQPCLLNLVTWQVWNKLWMCDSKHEAVFQKHASLQRLQHNQSKHTVKTALWVLSCFCSESGSCDLQAWLSCSWSHETKHALHELSAGRVSGQILHGFYHLMSFQLCFNCLTACLRVFQHHRHVWGVHSEPALLSDDLWSKLSLLQSPDRAWNRFGLLLFSGVCGFDDYKISSSLWLLRVELYKCVIDRFDGSTRQASFTIGLQGMAEADTETVKRIITQTIDDIIVWVLTGF